MDMIGEDSEDGSSLCPDSSGKRSFYKVNKFSLNSSGRSGRTMKRHSMYSMNSNLLGCLSGSPRRTPVNLNPTNAAGVGSLMANYC